MKEYGMGDEATIKEIISEVDTDNVSGFQTKTWNFISETCIMINSFVICRMEGSITRSSVQWWEAEHNKTSRFSNNEALIS